MNIQLTDYWFLNMIKNRILLRQEIGDFLRTARISKSLTGIQLGKMLHISQQQISRYERGETSINIETLDVLLKVLDMDWSDFFFNVMVNYSTKIAEIKLYR